MGTDYVRFVITGDARTGSNMLASALNTNPQIRCFREVFQFWKGEIDYYIPGYSPFNAKELELRNTDPVRFLQERIFCDHPEQYRAVGFKYLYAHLWGFDPLTEYLTGDRGVRIIHLKRRNWMRTLVSARIARTTGEWLDDAQRLVVHRPMKTRLANIVRHPARAVSEKVQQRLGQRLRPHEKPRLHLTKDECEEWFGRTAWEVGRTTAMFIHHDPIEIWYEDLVADPVGEFRKVQQVLGVDCVQLDVTLRKQNPEPLRELIANYDELRAAFAGTEYERWFDD